MSNSIFTIVPYLWHGVWVFDDASRGLKHEAFVAGIDDILDMLTAQIPGAERGFICHFSATPFPGANVTLRHVRHDEQGGQEVGNYYFCEQTQTEGWLCPALFKYFPTAPQIIHARFLPRGRKTNKPKTTETK